jgi:hypothetical protein
MNIKSNRVTETGNLLHTISSLLFLKQYAGRVETNIETWWRGMRAG